MWDYPYKYQAPVDPPAAAAEGAPAEEGKADAAPAAAPAAAPPAAFAQVNRVIYPVRMSDRDYVNANMWDGKYPENFNPDVEGNTASRVQALNQKNQDDFDSTSVAGPAHTDQIGQSVYDSAIIDPNANKRNPVGIIGNYPMWTYNGQKESLAQNGRVIYPVRMSDRDYVNANMWDGKYPENFDQNVAGNTASRSQQAAFAQVGRVIYPVRMSDRDYVNANMWDGKYPENFDPNVAGNGASRSQQGLAQVMDTDIIERIKRNNDNMRDELADNNRMMEQ